MSENKIIKVRISLKGRPMKSYRFDKEVVTVGRNPDADIFLDNPGVSRDHLRLVRTSGGYYLVEDLGSANGTVVNDSPVQREYLMNNDVIRVGKFGLWVSYEEDARARNSPSGPIVTAKTYEGTTVLSGEDLDQMTRKRAEARPSLSLVEGGTATARKLDTEEIPVDSLMPEPVSRPRTSPSSPLPALVWLFAGAILGSILTWLLMRS